MLSPASVSFGPAILPILHTGDVAVALVTPKSL